MIPDPQNDPEDALRSFAPMEVYMARGFAIVIPAIPGIACVEGDKIGIPKGAEIAVAAAVGD